VSEQEPPRALLVVASPDRTCATCLVYLLIAIGGIGGAVWSVEVFPKLPWNSGFAEASVVGLFFAFLAGVAVFVWKTETILARAGRVTFLDDQVVFEKPGVIVGVRWDEILAYDDGSADFVQVLMKERASSSRAAYLTIPTRAERDRVAVLELLDRRGVPRREA
jgi:hypothetical protein